MFRNITFLIILFVAVNSIVSAQLNFNRFDSDWDDYEMFNWSSDSHPFLEVNYGNVQPKHKKYSDDFTKLGLGELKIGFNSRDVFFENYITEFNEKFFFISNISKEFVNEDNEMKTELEAWRFGLGTRDGYGYRFGNTFSILPYNQGAFVWTKVSVKEVPYGVAPFLDETILTAEDNEILDRYEGSFRFGTLAEGGIMFEFGSIVSVNAGYEASVIYPRHLFWKQAGSMLIEGAGIAFIDYFVDEVIDSSPVAGPIVNFVLKNAYSYAFYSLKKSDMNWPFSTETPLTMETFKLGLSFRF